MKRNILVFLSACLLFSLSLLAAIPATGSGTTQIDGFGVFVPDCDGQTSYLTMALTGSLSGCWYTNPPTSSITPSGLYQEWGTEMFVGCLAQTGCGSFATTYKFTGKFAPTGEEIHGRCEHKIVTGSGTGVFTGAGGRLDFKDDVENAIFYYRGHVMLESPSLRHGGKTGALELTELEGEDRSSC